MDKSSILGKATEPQFPASETLDSTAPAESESGLSSVARSAGGPRTANGKVRSKLNALKHGLFSKAVLLKDDPRADFEYLLDELRNDRQPVGMLEDVLVEKLAAVLWRYRRLLIAEGQRFEKAKEIIILGLEPDEMHMDLLLRYGTSLDRELERILKQLDRLQRMRLGQPVPPSIDVNIATE